MKRLAILIFVAYSMSLSAQYMPIILPSIISDHAVLQQSSEVKLWGWGPSKLDVCIVASWAPTDTLKAFVENDCTWETTIKTPKAGGPYTIDFSYLQTKVTINDIMIGEAWLCSGQSNMGLMCEEKMFNAGEELKAGTNNNIRFFQVENTNDIYPNSNCNGKWVVCDSLTRAYFSAVGYFFGNKLQCELKVPVGLISSTCGATRIQPWIPKEVIEKDKYLNHLTKKFSTPWAPQAGGVLYNSMIHPLAPYTLAGIIWYQGESNALLIEEAKYYGAMMENLIESWRQVFQKELPFYFVQIAPFDGYYPKNAAAYLREQQEKTLRISLTGMINISDLVNDVKDIHPLLKSSVGRRMANLVLNEQYGLQNIQPYSPKFNALIINEMTAEVSVSSIGRLTFTDKEIKSFEIAGSDQIFYPAKAVLTKDGNISINSKKVKLPVAVRYCFSNEGIPNLFDTNGLPLMPFRTDNW